MEFNGDGEARVECVCTAGGYLKAALTSIPLSFLLERIFLHDIKNSSEALSAGNKLQPVPRNSASDHNHGSLKSTVAVSGRGLPKIEIGHLYS